MPSNPEDARWEVLVDTSYAAGLRSDGFFKPGDEYPLGTRSMVVLVNRQPDIVGEEDE